MRNSRIAVVFVWLLACVASQPSTVSADLIFRAVLDASQVVGGTSTETGTGIATFVLDDAQENLSYSLQLFGLDLKPVPGDRVEFSDVDKIHLHNGFAGESGPHVLNIFGLPSEDDSEMVVDFVNESLTGVYNDEDAIDPNGGGLFDQNNPGTTKLLSNFADDLIDGQLYIAIHTAGQNGDVAIRGQIVAVPEPGAGLAFALGGLIIALRRRR